MSGSVNKVIIIGHLGKDPETRYAQSGKAVCNFSVATGESWTDKSGQKQEKTEWHTIVVWDKLAELCQQYLAKGRQVYIEGRLQTRKWQDKDGNDRYSTEIVANQVTFLGSGDRQQGGQSQAGGQRQQSTGGQGPGPGAESSGFDDNDIPF